MLEFEKEGFITKRILFDTRSNAINYGKKYKPFDLELLLLEDNDGFVYDDVDFPVTRIEYSEKEQDFVYVLEYTKRMMKKQERFLEELTSLE